MHLHVHQLNRVMHIYSQYHKLWFNDTLVMGNLQILNQFKGNHSWINDAILIKFYMHHQVMMIHIQSKFNEILFLGFLVTAQFVIFTLVQGQ